VYFLILMSIWPFQNIMAKDKAKFEIKQYNYTVKYHLLWQDITVGHLCSGYSGLEDLDSLRCYHFFLEIKVNILNSVYRLDTWVDTTDFLTRRLKEEKIERGKLKEKTTVDFDQEYKYAVFNVKKKDTSFINVKKMLPNVCDYLTLIYNIKNIPEDNLYIGKIFIFNTVDIGKESSYPLKVKIIDEEKKDGSDCFQFRLLFQKGSNYFSDTTTVWVRKSDKMILRIEHGNVKIILNNPAK